MALIDTEGADTKIASTDDTCVKGAYTRANYFGGACIGAASIRGAYIGSFCAIGACIKGAYISSICGLAYKPSKSFIRCLRLLAKSISEIPISFCLRL